MSIRVVTLTTTKEKILTYDSKRRILVLKNRSSLNKVQISEVFNPEAPFFTIEPLQAFSFIRELGDDPRLELWGKTDTGTAELEIIEFFE